MDSPLVVNPQAVTVQCMNMDDMLTVIHVHFIHIFSFTFFMQGLYLPPSVTAADAIAISIAYSAERDIALHAAASLAEHRYRQSLIAARCYRLQMVHTHEWHRKVRADIERFRGYVRDRVPVINISCNSSLGMDQLVLTPFPLEDVGNKSGKLMQYLINE